MRRSFAAAIFLCALFAGLFASFDADARPRKARSQAMRSVVSQVDDSRYIGSGGMVYREPVRGLKRAGRTVARSAYRSSKRVVSATVSGSVGLVAAAERHIGATASQLGLPRSQWCSDFMNRIAPGHGTDRRARSWARAGVAASRGCIGCIAVLTRGRNGGHVGVVKGWQGGNPVIISGNHNRRVGVGVYPASRLVALRHV